MAAEHRPDTLPAPTVLALPFNGSWLAMNSPARRVPSHGTHVMAVTYAIDFVGVDARGRTSTVHDWRTVLAREPADRFHAFGRAILSPVDGRVVSVHDGEPDHPAQRSLVMGLGYLLTQRSRLRLGAGALAGNHVVIEIGTAGRYVLLAHLRRGSLRVRPGDVVASGQEIATCGNSGNSTQPHLHIQVMDSPNGYEAHGLPLAFRDYLGRPKGAAAVRHVPVGVPGEGERVEPA
jgi:hypothetical protein